MRLETLEKFVNLPNDLWSRDHLEKLIVKFGEKSIYSNIDNIDNTLIKLFSKRYYLVNDKTISEFIKGNGEDYLYIIDFIDDYLDHLEFIMWPGEIGLQNIYRILCIKTINNPDIDKDSDILKGMTRLAKKISDKRFVWVKENQKRNERRDIND